MKNNYTEASEMKIKSIVSKDVEPNNRKSAIRIPTFKNPSIQVKDLYFSYGDGWALENISLEIPEKQVTAFIGPSGCGKSTLLRTFNRLNDLIEGARTEGEIFIHGREIFDPTIDVTE
ncbi:MAG: ATP-binding cassette domain-containing protein, partial [bacterium]